jgi:integrase
MSCHVKVNRHGYLAFRLYWQGRESWEGTALRDTPGNRAKMEARATVMAQEIRDRSFDYLRWFPKGNKAPTFRPAGPAALAVAPTVEEYAERTWLPRKVPPMVRASLADTYEWAVRHVLRRFRGVRLDEITPARLEDFRAYLTRPEREGGRGLKMKTCRDIVDGSFRALYRDARDVDQLVTGDPFAALRWPAKVDPEPDPFTEAERDALVAYFAERDQHYHALVFTMFYTGLRTAEAVGLRWGDVDLRGGSLTVRRSRTMGEDNAPKTRKSRRTMTLLPEVVAVLRDAKPLHVGPDSFVFTTAVGTPLAGERFVEKHWHRALRATGVRPRKFYATRHTFLSVGLTRGANLKWLADYCGTSVEMIERHYGRFMHSDAGQLAMLGPVRAAEPVAVRAVAGRRGPSGPGARRRPETFPETFSRPAKNVEQTRRRGGDSNSRGRCRPGGFQDRCLQPGSATPPGTMLNVVTGGGRRPQIAVDVAGAVSAGRDRPTAARRWCAREGAARRRPSSPRRRSASASRRRSPGSRSPRHGPRARSSASARRRTARGRGVRGRSPCPSSPPGAPRPSAPGGAPRARRAPPCP